MVGRVMRLVLRSQRGRLRGNREAQQQQDKQGSAFERNEARRLGQPAQAEPGYTDSGGAHVY